MIIKADRVGKFAICWNWDFAEMVAGFANNDHICRNEGEHKTQMRD
jgi:hypothetical protein